MTATATATVVMTAASAFTITATPTTAVADGRSTSEITVTLTDGDNHPLSAGGDIVTIDQQSAPPSDVRARIAAAVPTADPSGSAMISAVTDQGDGTYTATLTAPDRPETIILSFTVDGIPALNTAAVTFTAVATAPALVGETAPVALADTGFSTAPPTGAALAALLLAGLIATGVDRHRRRGGYRR